MTTAAGGHVRRLDAAQLAEPLAVTRLSVACYEHVLAGETLAGPARTAAGQLRGHERAHLAALARLAGARGRRSAGALDPAAADRALAARGVPQRLDALRGPGDALELLLSVERRAVGAAYAAVGRLLAPDAIRRLAEIMGSDAQHEVVLRELLAPGDVAGAVPFAQVQGALPPAR